MIYEKTHKNCILNYSKKKKKKKKILGEIPFFFFLQNCLVDLTEYPLTLRYIASSFARITL